MLQQDSVDNEVTVAAAVIDTDTAADYYVYPQYYRENFFSNDTLYSEQLAGRSGVAGDPIPYTIRGDNFFTALLLFCLLLFIVSVSHSQRFIVRQLRDFFYLPHNDTNIRETSGELRFQLFLVLLNCLLLSIASYQYVTDYIDTTFVVTDYQMLGIFLCSFIMYYLVKGLLYGVVNSVFFNPYLNKHWLKLFLFLTATESVMLFPVVMLIVYFDLSFEKAVYYFVFTLILTKILTIYKCWSIFFRQNGAFLQIFLYFCTLEIVPLFGLIVGLVVLIQNLKLIF
jgi:hypothetical protein